MRLLLALAALADEQEGLGHMDVTLSGLGDPDQSLFGIGASTPVRRRNSARSSRMNSSEGRWPGFSSLAAIASAR